MNQGSGTNELVDMFCGITGASANDANRFLTMARGNINVAVSLYYSYQDEIIARNGGSRANINKTSNNKHKNNSDENDSDSEEEDDFYDEFETGDSNDVAKKSKNNKSFDNTKNNTNINNKNRNTRKSGSSEPKQRITKTRKPLFVKRNSRKSTLKLRSLFVGLDLTKQMKIVSDLNKDPISNFEDAMKLATSAHKPLIIFIHSPLNVKSKKTLKLFESDEVRKLIRKSFIFYATSIYHDEFDELISINMTASCKSNTSRGDGAGGPGGRFMGPLADINGGQNNDIVTDGFVEYPYIGVVMPFGVDGIQKPRRIQNSLMSTKNNILGSLKHIIGNGGRHENEGGNKIENVDSSDGSQRDKLLRSKRKGHHNEHDTSLVDASDEYDVSSNSNNYVDLNMNTNINKNKEQGQIQGKSQLINKPNTAIEVENEDISSVEDSDILEYVLRNGFGRSEMAKFEASATVDNLLHAALLFIKRVEDESATKEGITIICRNPPVQVSHTSDPGQLLSTLIPNQSSLIITSHY